MGGDATKYSMQFRIYCIAIYSAVRAVVVLLCVERHLIAVQRIAQLYMQCRDK